MKCNNCGAELDNGVLFCKDCGAKVEVKKVAFCRESGSPLADGVKFCSNCGADVNAVNNLGNTSAQPKVQPKVQPTPARTQSSPKSSNPSDIINSKMQEASSKFSEAASKFSDTVSSSVKSSANKATKQNPKNNKNALILICIAVVLLLFVALSRGGKDDKSNDTQTSNTNIPAITEVEYGDLTIEAGSQYAFMSDEWNVYIVNAISDSVIKLEHWDKTLSSSKTLKYSEDIGTYKINDPENGFAWIDEEHTAFALTFKDKNNSRVKKEASHIFTININDDDKFKGTDYDESIACYSYTCDDWHMYRAIPLTESLIKIECWARSSSLDKFCFGWDWCVIDLNNNDTDFEWTDAQHNGFTITTQDTQNKSYWKEPTFVSFMLENENYKYSDVYSYLGKGSAAADSRSQKDGFSNNSTVNVGNFAFSIPTYWQADIIESDHYRAYAETSGKVAMLEINSLVDNDDPVNFDILKKENDEGLMAASFESWYEKSEEATSESFDNGVVRGYVYSLKFTQDGLEGTSSTLCFPSEEDSKWFYVTLCQTNNTEYLYDEDYSKILDSICGAVAKQEEVKKEETKPAEEKKEEVKETTPKEEEKKEEKTVPTMDGTSLSTVVDQCKSLGLSEVYDEDFGHGTRMKAMQDSSGGLMIDIIYYSSTKEIMCASITTNKLASSKDQKAFVKGVASVLCPTNDSSDVTSWVNSNVGSKAEKEINGFTYELSLGPVDNILYYAGEREWEDWDLKQN